MKAAVFKKSEKGYYFFPPRGGLKGFLHAFSGRGFGDLSYADGFPDKPGIKNFLKTFGGQEKDLILARQPHGSQLKVVGRSEGGRVITGVDGLVTRQKGVWLGIKSSDCLPLLFFDPVRRTVAAVHAGWRGVYKGLPAKAVDRLIRLGSLPENILVFIGPAIGGCCYNVDAKLVQSFVGKFGKIPGMMTKKKGKFFLDILAVAKSQLHGSAIPLKNLSVSGRCTGCENDKFFSQRRDPPGSGGSMLAVIGLVDQKVGR